MTTSGGLVSLHLEDNEISCVEGVAAGPGAQCLRKSFSLRSREAVFIGDAEPREEQAPEAPEEPAPFSGCCDLKSAAGGLCCLWPGSAGA